MIARTDDVLPFAPLVIIGAGRSGTNALRDALTRLPGFATWPCDEINPIWRHGNLDWPDDELPAERATPAIRRAIRKAFMRIWRQRGRPDFVVEKTCANALRVPFVEAVLPEARYLHIVRNGFDIVASARKRWRGELEMPGLTYYLSKARYAPLSDLPRYALSAIRNRVAIKLGRQEHFDSWGPRFAGQSALAGPPLDEIVALQWAACVNASDAAFAQMASSRVMNVRYEDLANNPQGSLEQITRWLEYPRDKEALREAASLIRATSVGKGQSAIEGLSNEIKAVLEVPLRAHGYLSQE